MVNSAFGLVDSNSIKPGANRRAPEPTGAAETLRRDVAGGTSFLLSSLGGRRGATG